MDYYNGNEYNHEEEMPVRCGIMHIRGNATETACKKDGKFFAIHHQINMFNVFRINNKDTRITSVTSEGL